MKKTGEILRKAREEKGLSLHEIGLSLKINSKVLKAIEEADEAHLPAKTFLRGFVQSYANFLHLDSDKVLEIFYEEMGSTKPKPYIRPTDTPAPAETVSTSTTTATAPVSETPVKEKESIPKEAPAKEASVTPIRATPPPSKKSDLKSLNESKTTRNVAILIVGAVLIGLILFTKKMIDKYSKEAEVPSNEVAETMEGATPVIPEAQNTTSDVDAEAAAAPNEGGISALTTPAASPTISTQAPSTTATASATATAAPTATATTKPTATPTPSPAPTATAAATPVATPTATPTPAPTPTPSPTPKEAKPVELIVEALDSVEIEYSAPNGKPQKIKLSAEQVHTFKSKSGLRIGFSNGGAVNLILNGKEVGIPGDLGKPIRLSY
ncbi:helix-turn-helix domain-containing protein [Bdellovibrio bacteriovorus]